MYCCIVHSLSHVPFFVTPWTAASQASLSITTSWSLLKHMCLESMMHTTISSSAKTQTGHTILWKPWFKQGVLGLFNALNDNSPGWVKIDSEMTLEQRVASSLPVSDNSGIRLRKLLNGFTQSNQSVIRVTFSGKRPPFPRQIIQLEPKVRVSRFTHSMMCLLCLNLVKCHNLWMPLN